MRGWMASFVLALLAGPAMAQDWGGFYAGVLGGYGAGDVKATTVNLTRPLSGNLAGVTVGYRTEQGPITLGIEGDLFWSNMQFRDSSSTITLQTLSTLRLQVGLPVGDWALPYVTAGLAVGSGRMQIPAINQDYSRINVGATAGVGVEVAVTDLLSIKAEHLRVGLGATDYSYNAAPSLIGFDFGVTRIGLNARF